MEVTKENIEELTARTLNVMIITGIHPKKPINKILVSFWGFYLIVVTGLAAYNAFTNNIEIEKLPQAFQGLSMLCCVWTKYPIHFVAKKGIKNLLEDIHYFWGSKEIGTSLLINIRRIQNLYVGICVIGIGMFFLPPVYSSSLVLECYVPTFVPFYIFAPFNSMIIILVSAANITIEAFLMTLMMVISLQFKTLRHEILKIRLGLLKTTDQIENCKQKLIRCVKYHQFLMRYVEKFNSVNSYNAFVQIFLTEVVICLELYLMKRIPSTVQMIIFGSVIFIVVAQVTILDIWPAEMLTSEASKLMFAVYNLDWYKCEHISVRKFLIVMMHVMQYEIKIRGGNFFIMTLKTSTMVFKAAYTMFTFLNSL